MPRRTHPGQRSSKSGLAKINCCVLTSASCVICHCRWNYAGCSGHKGSGDQEKGKRGMGLKFSLGKGEERHFLQCLFYCLFSFFFFLFFPLFANSYMLLDKACLQFFPSPYQPCFHLSTHSLTMFLCKETSFPI